MRLVPPGRAGLLALLLRLRYSLETLLIRLVQMRDPKRRSKLLVGLLASAAAIAYGVLHFVASAANEVFGKPFAQKILEDWGLFKEPWKHFIGVLASIGHFASAHALWLIPAAFVVGAAASYANARRVRIALRRLFGRRRLKPSLATLAEEAIYTAALNNPHGRVIVNRHGYPANVPDLDGWRPDVSPDLAQAELVTAVERLKVRDHFVDPIGRGELYDLTPVGRRFALSLQGSSGLSSSSSGVLRAPPKTLTSSPTL